MPKCPARDCRQGHSRVVAFNPTQDMGFSEDEIENLRGSNRCYYCGTVFKNEQGVFGHYSDVIKGYYNASMIGQGWHPR